MWKHGTMQGRTHTHKALEETHTYSRTLTRTCAHHTPTPFPLETGSKESLERLPPSQLNSSQILLGLRPYLAHAAFR